MSKLPAKYHVGDHVLVQQIYVIDEHLKTVELEKPLCALVKENKGHTSLGYAYILDIKFEDDPPHNLAPVCYWEDHILTKVDDPEETFWKVWGDR